jgi:hypothetical protein
MARLRALQVGVYDMVYTCPSPNFECVVWRFRVPPLSSEPVSTHPPSEFISCEVVRNPLGGSLTSIRFIVCLILFLQVSISLGKVRQHAGQATTARTSS